MGVNLLNLLPRLLSSVSFNSVDEIVVQGDEVADEGSGTQAQATSLWQQYLHVCIQTQIIPSVIVRQLYLS